MSNLSHRPVPSCLIVVDLQHQFINDHTRHLAPAIQSLLHRFDWVFASRLIPRLNSPMQKWKGFTPCAETEYGSQLALDFSSRAAERTRVIEKSGFGALTTDARRELVTLGVETAHVCGVDTDLCVLRTAGDLMELGIRPLILTDLVGSTAGEPLHSGALLILKRLVGKAQLTTAATLNL